MKVMDIMIMDIIIDTTVIIMNMNIVDLNSTTTCTPILKGMITEIATGIVADRGLATDHVNADHFLEQVRDKI